MTAIIAMQDVVDRSKPVRKGGLIARAREMISVCSRAAEAAHVYEDLKRLSDQELARRGLKRSDLSRAVFDKLTRS